MSAPIGVSGFFDSRKTHRISDDKREGLPKAGDGVGVSISSLRKNAVVQKNFRRFGCSLSAVGSVGAEDGSYILGWAGWRRWL